MRGLSSFCISAPIARNLAAAAIVLVLSACNPLIGNPSDNPNYHPGVPDGASASPTTTPTPGPTSTPTITPTPTPGTVDNTEALFNEGSYTGIAWDSSNGYIRMGSDGTCNGLTTNCAELSSAWTPAWSNLVGYWKLDDVVDSGTVADSSGSGNTGTVEGGITLGVTGKLNTSANFDGTTGYITTPDSATMSDLSFTAWINGTAFTSGNHNMIICGTGQNTYISVYNGALFGKINATNHFGVTLLKTDMWYHVAMAFNHTSQTITLYVNGAQDLSETDTNSLIAQTYDIGADGSSLFFDGSIDDVAIWNTALTATEVQTIYSRQSPLYAGTFTSRVMDSYYTGQIWQSLGWTTTLPFYKSLPDNGASESSSNYSSQTSSLMTDIVGLWHLDEASWNGTSGEVKDNSGQAADGTSVNGANTTSSGKLANAGSFSGASSQYVSISKSSPFAFEYNSPFTLSSWAKTTDSVNYKYIFSKEINASPYTGYHSAIMPNGKLYTMLINSTSAPNYIEVDGSSAVNDGNWHHLVVTYSGSGVASGVNLYVDGNVDSSATVVTDNLASNSILTAVAPDIGSRDSGGAPFYGSLDEVAIWSRALSTAEVLELYRRGANRIKYQIQSCSSSASCASSPNWMGSDGTNQTYFSELYNATNNILGDTVLSGAPSMIFGSLGFTELGLSVPTNEYFQYRAVMESDDVGNLCNYGSGAVPCSPELQTVSVGSTN